MTYTQFLVYITDRFYLNCTSYLAIRFIFVFPFLCSYNRWLRLSWKASLTDQESCSTSNNRPASMIAHLVYLMSFKLKWLLFSCKHSELLKIYDRRCFFCIYASRREELWMSCACPRRPDPYILCVHISLFPPQPLGPFSRK